MERCEVCGLPLEQNDTLRVSGYSGEYDDNGGHAELICVNPNCPLFALGVEDKCPPLE